MIGTSNDNNNNFADCTEECDRYANCEAKDTIGASFAIHSLGAEFVVESMRGPYIAGENSRNKDCAHRHETVT